MKIPNQILSAMLTTEHKSTFDNWNAYNDKYFVNSLRHVFYLASNVINMMQC